MMGQHGEAPVDIHQLAVEGRQLREIILPTEAARHLKARPQHAEMPQGSQPERDVQEMESGRDHFERAWIACMKGRMTRRTNGG